MTLDLEKMAREWLESAIGKDFYEPQERAMAPGIAGDWPPFIKAPQSRHGRLKRIETTALLPKLLEFARSVQKATQSSVISASLSGQTIKFTRHPKYPLDGCDPAKCSDINHYFYEVVAEEEG